MKRLLRAFSALLAITTFLFSQAVMAAYACAGPIEDPAAMAQMKAQMEGDGGLCEKHCATGTVSFELAKPGAVSMPSLVSTELRVVAPAPAPAAYARPVRAEPLSVAGPGPPLIRFTVLRI